MVVKNRGFLKKQSNKPVNVIKIPIDVTGKQILVIKGITMEDEGKKRLIEYMHSWMASDDPVGLLFADEGVVMQVIKVNHHRPKKSEDGNVKQEGD